VPDQGPPGCDQGHVPPPVSRQIVDFFEVVQIEEEDGARPGVAGGGLPLPLVPVEDPGQGIL